MVWKRKSGGGGDEEERVPRGHVPMVVAGGGERVLVPVRLLSDPRVAELLEMAAQRYGYGQPGVLRVPCDAGRFRQVVDGAMQRLVELHGHEMGGRAPHVCGDSACSLVLLPDD
ncbi:auxin-responsive protein SAUR71-like [Panicum virgatum]|nr:auxin-responsive protein SAUR71-like [Panicum virgatum]